MLFKEKNNIELQIKINENLNFVESFDNELKDILKKENSSKIIIENALTQIKESQTKIISDKKDHINVL